MRQFVLSACVTLLVTGCSGGDRAAFATDVQREWARIDAALSGCEQDHARYHEQNRDYDRALSCAKRKETFMDAHRALMASAKKNGVGGSGGDFYEALRACEKGVDDFWREDSIYTRNIGDTVGSVSQGIGERHRSANANLATCRSTFREVAAAKGIDLDQTPIQAGSLPEPVMSNAPPPTGTEVAVAEPDATSSAAPIIKKRCRVEVDGQVAFEAADCVSDANSGGITLYSPRDGCTLSVTNHGGRYTALLLYYRDTCHLQGAVDFWPADVDSVDLGPVSPPEHPDTCWRGPRVAMCFPES